MPTTFSIRVACSEDLAAIARLERAVFGASTEAHIAPELNAMRQEGAKLLVAERDDCDDGSAVIGHVGFWVYHRHCELFTLAVDPGWRGQGIARGLLERVVRGMNTHGLLLARARVPVGNGTGVACFLHCGWKPCAADETDTETAAIRLECYSADPGLAVLRSLIAGEGAVVRGR